MSCVASVIPLLSKISTARVNWLCLSRATALRAARTFLLLVLAVGQVSPP